MYSSTENLALIVLAAGKGTRMKSRTPKVMHGVAGRPMVDWALAAGQDLGPQRVVVVLGPELEDQANDLRRTMLSSSGQKEQATPSIKHAAC